VFCIHNISSTEQPLRVNLKALDIPGENEFQDLISGTVYAAGDQALVLPTKPYQVLWLEALT
jgi:hypothetical protein